MKTRLGFLAIAALAGLRCGDDPEPADAGVGFADAAPLADAEAAEAGFSDAEQTDLGRADGGASPEAGVLFNAVSCRPCDECAANECLRNPNTRESFCADRCDDDTTACITGFSCLDLGGEGSPVYFCLSPASSCRPNSVGLGSACFGDTSSCMYRQDQCEGDSYALGYCTHFCNNDGECPFGWSCTPSDVGDLACRPDFRTDEETCARADDGAELACAVDEDCESWGAGAECVRSAPTLPGVCALPCDDQSCESGTCATTLRGKNCLPDRCACHGTTIAGGTRDLLGEALESTGISRCSTIFSIFDWSAAPGDMRFDPYRLSFFDRVHDSPLGAPAWATSTVKQLDTRIDPARDFAYDAARMIEDLADLVDRPATHRAPGTIDPVNPLASAVASLISDNGGMPDVPALRADAADVPMDLQLALAQVIEAIERAAAARDAAIAANARGNIYAYGPAFVISRSDGFGLAPANTATQRLLNDQIGYGAMYGAAADVLDAISTADLSRFAIASTATVATSTAVLLFSADTPLGRIAIGDGESGIYDERIAGYGGAWALLIDLGGADEYRVPIAGNISVENSVSVMIDLGGDDRYGYVEQPHPLDGARLPSDSGGRYTPSGMPNADNGPISFSEVPRQGGARAGTAIHVDLGAGDDRYRSLRLSQGAGAFGTGVLIDEGGNDLYEAEAFAQGAGSFGIGLLLDGAGNDERRAYTMSQGFAYARAAGLSYDVAGDDRYLMDPGDPAVGGDPLYFNGQRPGRANTTLGQGWGFGRRADFTDRAFMSGGVGILIDRTGADTYRGSVFAQGGGFWFGTGILADEEGGDSYDGLWYAMGAAAHYSLGFLLDGAGDDRYGGELPKVNVTIAGGHDYSAAFVIDESGDDIYQGSRITIGGGNSNGMGFFADNEGNDSYDAVATYSFGAAGLVGSDVDFLGSARRRINVVGVFLDGAGRDSYSRMGMSVEGFMDDASWVQFVATSSVINQIERGAGIDGDGETSFHARF